MLSALNVGGFMIKSQTHKPLVVFTGNCGKITFHDHEHETKRQCCSARVTQNIHRERSLIDLNDVPFELLSFEKNDPMTDQMLNIQ